MISNICKIENGTKDLAAILDESERVAAYNGFDRKQTMQLRLLCEELDGMLPELVGDFDGKLWIEFEDGVCKIKVSIELAEISAERREQLISIAREKKNSAANGIIGKIRAAVEGFLLGAEFAATFATASESFGFATGVDTGLDYSYSWSLEKYRKDVGGEKKTEQWDELEKSVISSISDDVTVGVKGRCADITVTKKFF